jgi:hypothetical protein
MGTGNPHVDFFAIPGDDTKPAPIWGFLTRDNRFAVGGSFDGFVYGVEGHGGHPDDQGKTGPEFNDHSGHAGVFGTGVNVTGVAGTSIINAGVYGQAGEGEVPQGTVAGVFGAGPSMSRPTPGVIGFSAAATGVLGWGNTHFGVTGNCGAEGPIIPEPVVVSGVWGSSNAVHGVIGTSNAAVGVYGYSTNGPGVIGRTNNPATIAGGFFGNVGVTGNLQVVGTKSAVVPFPDGSRRALYCMESPELWFEDFGSAKLARGRALVKLDANFAKVIKRRDYRVFVTPEGNCHGLYVRRKSAKSFEIRELTGGKSSVAFSYRIVGRRKDIKQHRRFAKVDMGMPLPTRPPRTPRKLVPTAADLRAFVARVEKEARERAPKGAEKARARVSTKRSRPDFARLMLRLEKQ